MKYSSTSRLVNAIVFPILFLAFGALGVYFSFFVSPTYLSPLGEAQKFAASNAYNFSLNFGMLGMAVMALACYGVVFAIKALSDKNDAAVEKTFFVPVRFDKDLEAGYELCFQFGGNYYDDEEERRNSVTVFPDCDMRKTITSKLSLENGKIYGFKVTI